MNLKNLDPELLPIDKLPHLRFQYESVDRSKKIIACLEKRKQLLSDILELDKDTTNLKHKYENNENELLLIKTDIELAKVHTEIIKKNQYIKELGDSLVSVLKEMEEKWSDLIEEAENKKETNSAIEKFMTKLDMPFFDSNWEYAIDFYVNLKHLVYPELNEESTEKPTLSKV